MTQSMQRKTSYLRRLTATAAMLAAWSGPTSFAAAWADEDFQYFSSPEVDYWKERAAQDRGLTRTAPLTLKPRAAAFPWQKYLDPKNDEFFKEGDYTPPLPFMEIARNPTNENIAHWFQYLETKNEVTRRLQSRLTEYAANRVASEAPLTQPRIPAAAVTRPVPYQAAPQPDAKRFRLRLYFDSKCPHCEHMIATLGELSALGFSIDLRQVDSDVSARAQIPFPVQGASASELKQYQIDGVPLLLVGDLKLGTFFKIQGYQTSEAVLQALQSAPNTQNPQSPGGRS